jgi:hypothetical protein
MRNKVLTIAEGTMRCLISNLLLVLFTTGAGKGT